MTKRHLLVAVSVIVALGTVSTSIVLIGYRLLEQEGLRVHPSEEAIANRIRTLNGSYKASGAQDWHITLVWLERSRVSDDDMPTICRLPELQAIDLSNTRVTDKSLPYLFSHPQLRSIRTNGSAITSDGLRAALEDSGDRIALDN